MKPVIRKRGEAVILKWLATVLPIAALLLKRF